MLISFGQFCSLNGVALINIVSTLFCTDCILTTLEFIIFTLMSIVHL